VEAEERIRMAPEGSDQTSEGSSTDRVAAAGDPPDAVTHERCVHHPGRGAVTRCGACEEPICLACAVPVRGRPIGPECLASELGDPDLTVPPEPTPATGSGAAVAGAVLALAATIGPWTRTGGSDRLFGAWVPSLRWSTVAAVSAVALFAAAWWFRIHATRAGATLVLIASVGVTAGSTMAIAYPPTFQAASWGPWVGVTGGVVALVGAITSLLRERRPPQGASAG
jgi:hypothetical protein